LIVTTPGLGECISGAILYDETIRQIRGTAMSVATIANWAANLAVTISFLTLLNAISDSGTSCSPPSPWPHWPTSSSRCPRPRASALQQIERQLT
jgi:hypothetical protein